MKFEKTKIKLPKPIGKKANSFYNHPKSCGSFAEIIEDCNARHTVFKVGDIVRISYNQRWAEPPHAMQVISITDKAPPSQQFMGTMFILPSDKIKVVRSLKPNSPIILVSDGFPIPVRTKLHVINHKGGLVTVEFKGKNYIIPDKFIEGYPYMEYDKTNYVEEGVRQHTYWNDDIHELPVYGEDDYAEDCEF